MEEHQALVNVLTNIGEQAKTNIGYRCGIALMGYIVGSTFLGESIKKEDTDSIIEMRENFYAEAPIGALLIKNFGKQDKVERSGFKAFFFRIFSK